MTPEQPLALIRAIYEHIGSRDIPAVLDRLDPRVNWLAPETLPYGGTYRGREGFQQYLGNALTHLDDDFQLLPDQFLVDDNHVVVTGSLTGRGRGTGRRLEAPFVHLWTVDDGRATQMRYLIDTAAVLEALEA